MCYRSSYRTNCALPLGTTQTALTSSNCALCNSNNTTKVCIYHAVALHIQQKHVILASQKLSSVTVAICHSANETTPQTKSKKKNRTARTIFKQSQKLRTLSWGSTLVIFTKSCTGSTPKMTPRNPHYHRKGPTRKKQFNSLKHSGFEQFKTYAAYGHTKCRISIAVHLRHQPKLWDRTTKRKFPHLVKHKFRRTFKTPRNTTSKIWPQQMYRTLIFVVVKKYFSVTTK